MFVDMARLPAGGVCELVVCWQCLSVFFPLGPALRPMPVVLSPCDSLLTWRGETWSLEQEAEMGGIWAQDRVGHKLPRAGRVRAPQAPGRGGSMFMGSLRGH